MSVEAATRIHQLNTSAPSNSDPVAQGAGHLRTVKAAIKGSFPAFGVGEDGGVVTLGADQINALQAASATANLVNTLYPVGSIYLSAVATNPGTTLGHGTWSQIAQGRFLAGVGTGTDSLSATREMEAGNTGGTYNHTLTVAQLPAHSHELFVRNDTGSSNNIEGFSHSAGNIAIAGEADGTKGYVSANSASTKLAKDTGSGQAHENTPPAFGVYVWQRTA
jgi:microcystin-dependent protein